MTFIFYQYIYMENGHQPHLDIKRYPITIKKV